MPSSEVMSKYKAGKLRSGGKGKGHPKVKSQKQAVAIMLSEKRKEQQHGGKYPEKAIGKALSTNPKPHKPKTMKPKKSAIKGRGINP